MSASGTATGPATAETPVWAWATDEHEIGLDPGSGAVVCRNAKGRLLKSVPKPVKGSATFKRLGALRDWLARHESECRATVERWMLGCMPIPCCVIAAVWPDPSWRTPLEHAIVTPGPPGTARCRHHPPGPEGPAGFLRGVDESGRPGIVDLDGETRWLDSATVVLPHPALLEDLDELRELAVDLQVEQGVQQLLREVHRKPANLDPARREVHDYAGGRFRQLRHALSRAGNLGFELRGGFASCRVLDLGVAVEARYWLGDGDPYGESLTGDLAWTASDGRQLGLGEVGPVAWSEGVRMASLIYAGRVAATGDGGR
jgi:hypothetical protein